VEIAPCGDRVCGKVVWLKNPKHKSKSGKLICGSQILGDLRKQARNLWESGWIYDPEDEGRIAHDDLRIGYDWTRGPAIK
jgi:uncharacterized protein (DUF2147 family)